MNSQQTLSSADFHSILPGIDYFFPVTHTSHEISYNPLVVKQQVSCIYLDNGHIILLFCSSFLYNFLLC